VGFSFYCFLVIFFKYFILWHSPIDIRKIFFVGGLRIQANWMIKGKSQTRFPF